VRIGTRPGTTPEALDEVAPALEAASQLSDPHEKVRELLAIALHGHEHGVEPAP
jgi:hypothetical protein